jgi:hypothetical protein
VQHRIETASSEDAVDRRAVANVGPLEVERRGVPQPSEVLVGTLPGEIVEDGDAPIARPEEARGIAAYEAGTASDQYSLSRDCPICSRCSITGCRQ